MTRGRRILTEDYISSGFGNRLGFGKKACLLIVDAVMAYLDQWSPLYAKVERELAAIGRLLQVARDQDIARIFTNVRYHPGGKDGGLFYKKIKALKSFDAGNPLANFPDSIKPWADELVVTKQYASAFFGTSLTSTLNASGYDTVIICGFTTSGCIRATALDALQNGFIPVVIKDACGDRNEQIQEANLFDLQAKYADVISEADALKWMENIPV